MKKFIIKNILFLIVLGAIISGSEYLVPYYWGTPHLVLKMNYYKKHKDEFNTLFIGSSHIFRDISPSVFDEFTNTNTHSFNLGVGAMCTLETYAFYENFLKKDISPNVKYVIMELAPIYRLPPKDEDSAGDLNFPSTTVQSARVKYYLNFPVFMFVVNYFKTGMDIYPNEEEEVIKEYTSAYIEKLFKVGMLKDMVMFNFQPAESSESQKEILGRYNDGFYSMDELTSKSVSDCVECRIKTAEEIDMNIKDAKAAYMQNQTLEANRVQLEMINKLIEQSRKKGIYSIFHLPPMSDYKLMLPIFDRIDVRHKLDLANPMEYPEFYEMDVHWDTLHFNLKGAKLFTKKLAEKFNRLVLKNSDDKKNTTS